jgi:isovaleryl-CoA dehydrogenase
MFFTGEGSANVQKIMIAEDALGYKLADRHHGKTGLRDIRKEDIVNEVVTTAVYSAGIE